MATPQRKDTPSRLPYLAGITGGIGAGKSAVSAIVAARYPVLHSDSIAKELLESDPGVVALVKNAFGNESYDSSGKPNRSFLASIVFSNPQKLAQLNSILHPPTLDVMLQTALDLGKQGANIVFVESALLFEAGVDDWYDAIIAVVSNEELIFERLAKQASFKREDIERRMANQLPQDEKAKLADFVIRNNGTLEELDRNTNLIIRIIESMARQHGTS